MGSKRRKWVTSGREREGWFEGSSPFLVLVRLLSWHPGCRHGVKSHLTLPLPWPQTAPRDRSLRLDALCPPQPQTISPIRPPVWLRKVTSTENGHQEAGQHGDKPDRVAPRPRERLGGKNAEECGVL